MPFDHDNIDHEEVTAVVTDLNKDKEAVEELHVRYEAIRKHETGPVEDALLGTDDDYIAAVKTKF